MKRLTKVWLLCVLLLLCMSVPIACKNKTPEPDPQPTPTPTVKTVELSESELTLDLLERQVLTATVKDGDGNVLSDTVTWSSSAPTVASVTAGGEVRALAAGTAVVKAALDEETFATCALTVENNGVLPQVILSTPQTEMLKSSTQTLSPSVRFKSATLSPAEYGIAFTYASSDEAIAEVSADGKITAKAVGTADITVTAVWAEATAADLAAKLTTAVTITVNPNVVVAVAFKAEYDGTIYLQAAADGQTEYRAETKLEVRSATVNGQPFTPEQLAQIAFRSSDETVAVVAADGTVTLAATAREGDTATVHAEFESEEGKTVSEKLTVVAKRAILTKSLDQKLTVDLSVEKITLQDRLSDIFGANDVTLDSITDSNDNDMTELWDHENGQLDASAVSLFGARKWLVCSPFIGYEVDAFVVSKILKTPEDLAMFNVNDIKAVFDGYYLLGNDIDASTGYTHVNKAWNTANDATGLTGTFDGNGKTIHGLKLGSGGFFTKIAATGTVKNVAFTDVEIDAPSGHAVVFCYNVLGKMQNVFVSIKSWRCANAGGNIGLCYSTGGNSALKNIVVVNNAVVENGLTNGQFGTLESAFVNGAWENTFVLSDMQLFGGKSAGDEGDPRYCKSVQRFTSMAALIDSDYYAEKKDTFDDTIWDRDALVFTSSIPFIKKGLDAMPSSIEASGGEPYQVCSFGNLLGVQVEGASQSLVAFENGNVVLNGLPSGALTLRYTWAGDATFEKSVAVTARSEIDLEGTEYEFNRTDGEDFVVDVPFVGSTVTASVAGTDGNAIEMQASVSGGKLTIPAAQFDNPRMPSGKTDVTLSVDGEPFTLKNLTLVYVANSVDDLQAMTNHFFKGVDSKQSANHVTGYIRLGKNIDMTGVQFVSGKWAGYNLYWYGTFDGDNRILTNMKCSTNNSGLFCAIQSGGLVKNVRLENLEIGAQTGGIAWVLSGAITNCYAKGKIVGENYTSGTTANVGAGLLAGRINATARITGCIAEFADDQVTEGFSISSAFGKHCGSTGSTETAVFSNCYAVNADGFTIRDYAGTVASFDTTNHKGNKNFATLAALLADADASKVAAAMGITA